MIGGQRGCWRIGCLRAVTRRRSVQRRRSSYRGVHSAGLNGRGGRREVLGSGQPEYRKDYSTNGRIIRVVGVVERGVAVLKCGFGVAAGGDGGFGENLGYFSAGEIVSQISAGFRRFPRGLAHGIFRYFGFWRIADIGSGAGGRPETLGTASNRSRSREGGSRTFSKIGLWKILGGQTNLSSAVPAVVE